jgi:hypothetical protein
MLALLALRTTMLQPLLPRVEFIAVPLVRTEVGQLFLDTNYLITTNPFDFHQKLLRRRRPKYDETSSR